MHKQILTIAAMVLFSSLATAQQNGPPSEADREKMRAAMDACFSETGISKPAQGQRPSEADRQALDTCLASKGISRPPGPPPGQRRQEQGQYDQGGNNSSYGAASVR